MIEELGTECLGNFGSFLIGSRKCSFQGACGKDWQGGEFPELSGSGLIEARIPYVLVVPGDLNFRSLATLASLKLEEFRGP